MAAANVRREDTGNPDLRETRKLKGMTG
jgi:hypothetical protein